MPDALLPGTMTIAEIHLGRLRHNVRVLQARAGRARVMGVVKADAYGHGAVRVVHVLREEGVRHFAVATVPEAIRLRQAGLADPILVLAAPLPEYLPAYVHHALDVTVSSLAVADAVIRTARTVGPLRVHVKVDTGMGRLGLSPEDVLPVVRRLERAHGVTLAGLWTHFATVDDPFVAEQSRRFAPLAEALRGTVPIHTANSGVLLTTPELLDLHEDALVRMGVALFGLYRAPGLTGADRLRPVMRLRSRVTHLKTVEAGTPVSYRGTWRAERRTRIATVGAGYADGLPRLLSNRGQVGVRGRLYPIAGVVCMDMLMVDLGPPDGPGGQVTPGDAVVLFGRGGPSPYAVARLARTITYELCCGIAARVPRVYLDPSLGKKKPVP